MHTREALIELRDYMRNALATERIERWSLAETLDMTGRSILFVSAERKTREKCMVVTEAQVNQARQNALVLVAQQIIDALERKAPDDE